MEVLASIFEAPIAEETMEASTSISETRISMGAVVLVPTEPIETEREFEEGTKKEPRPTPVAI